MSVHKDPSQRSFGRISRAATSLRSDQRFVATYSPLRDDLRPLLPKKDRPSILRSARRFCAIATQRRAREARLERFSCLVVNGRSCGLKMKDEALAFPCAGGAIGVR